MFIKDLKEKIRNRHSTLQESFKHKYDNTMPKKDSAMHRLVQQRHSYTTPEWIWWPARASGDYGAWLQDNCGTAGRETAAGPGPT